MSGGAGIAGICEQIYEAGGQRSVEDYVRTCHPGIVWARCVPCEADEPMEDGACLVCGTPTEGSL